MVFQRKTRSPFRALTLTGIIFISILGVTILVPLAEIYVSNKVLYWLSSVLRLNYSIENCVYFAVGNAIVVFICVLLSKTKISKENKEINDSANPRG